MALFQLCSRTLILILAFQTLLVLVSCQQNGRPYSNGRIDRSSKSTTLTSEVSISAVSVLLPQDSSVSYKLEAFNGCFRWTVTNPDVVDLKIKEEDQGCARRVYLSPSNRYKTGKASPVSGSSPSSSGQSSSSSQSSQSSSQSPSTSLSMERERTWIIAEEKTTFATLRAEVFVDSIHRFEIITVNRNLRKDDVEVLEIQAFDGDGNAFSTLDGLEFQWTVQSDQHSKDASSLLQLLPLANSHYEVSDAIAALESEGKQSSIVLAHAKSTGRVNVFTKLVDPKYSLIKSQSVVLSILEPLHLVPPHLIYLMPFSIFKYYLLTMERDSTRNISMPNHQYVWSSSNPQIASVDDSGIVTTYSDAGSSKIEVTFTAVNDNNAYSHLKVSMPTSMTISLLPISHDVSIDLGASVRLSSSSKIISGLSYHLQAPVYDSDGNRFFSTESAQFHFDIDPEFFSIEYQAENSGSFVLLAKKSGITKIRGQVRSLGSAPPSLLENLVAEEDVTIVEPLRIHPNLTRVDLPYHPGVKHSLTLTASGGTGSYEWSTSNRVVFSVTNQGILTANHPGNGTLKCVDDLIPYNKVELPASVSIPHSAMFVTSSRETEMNHGLILGLALMSAPSNDVNQHFLAFDNCASLPFFFNQSNAESFSQPTVVECPLDLVQAHACVCIKTHARKVGNSVVSMRLEAFSSENPITPIERKDDDYHVNQNNGNINHNNFNWIRHIITAETVIASFEPVKVTPERIMLTYGTSVELTVVGGPHPSSYDTPVVPSIVTENPALLSIETISSATSKLIWKYRITCLEHGSQHLTISVGNMPSPANPMPVFAHHQIPFSCQVPSTLFLLPSYPFHRSPNQENVIAQVGHRIGACSDDSLLNALYDSNHKSDAIQSLPIPDQLRHYYLRSGFSHSFDLAAISHDGFAFNNFSSLSIEWSLQETSIVKFGIQDDSNHHRVAESDANHHIFGKTRRVLQTEEAKRGTTFLNIKVTGWDKSMLSNLPTTSSSTFFSSFPSIVPTLDISPLNVNFKLEVSPNSKLNLTRLSLFNHPDNSAKISCLYGSSYRQVRSNHTSATMMTVEPGTTELYVRPISVGISKYVVFDNCLVGSNSSVLSLRVSDIHSIRVKSPSILQYGTRATMEIEVMDSAGEIFPNDQLKFMDIKIHVEGNSVSLSNRGSQSSSSLSSSDSTSSSSSDSDGGTSQPDQQPDSPPSPVPQSSRSQRSKKVSGSGSSSSSSFGGGSISRFSLMGDQPILDAFGSNIGISSISVIAMNANGMFVSSDPVTIQVFPPLEVYPMKMELLPGGSFQLEIHGGPPSRNRVAYTVSNSSIASVSNDGLVMTKNLLGSTTIDVQVFVKESPSASPLPSSHPDSQLQQHPSLIYSQQVVLKVKHLGGILIHASTTRLIVGEEIVVRVTGIDGEPPFVWSGLDLAFQWEAVNPEILGLSAIYSASDDNLTGQDEQGFSVIVKALSAGITRLSARIVAGPSFLGAKSASLVFEVVPTLSILSRSKRLAASTSSEFTRTTNYHQRLLLAPHTRYHVRTNLPSSMSLLDPDFVDDYIQSDSIVRLDTKAEQILSTGVAGVSIVQAKDPRDQQQLLMNVYVKPIHHVELRAVAPVSSSLPVGSSQDYEIVLRDNLGFEFDSYEHTTFQWHLSKQDVIQAEVLKSNESEFRQVLRVRGVRPGTTFICLSVLSIDSSSLFHSSSQSASSRAAGTTHGNLLSSSSNPVSQSFQPNTNNPQNPNLQHYHQIKVANSIIPLDPVVHVGGTVQFHTTFDPSAISGRAIWSTTNTTVLQIDSHSGSALALASGRSNVHFSSTVFTMTPVRVMKVASIEIDSKNCKRLTNLRADFAPELERSCQALVKFRDPEGREFTDSASIKHQIQANCITSEPSLVKAELLSFDREAGHAICQFTSITGESNSGIYSSSHQSNIPVDQIALKVEAYDLAKSYMISQDVKVPFVSAFIMLDPQKTYRLSPITPSVEITVVSSSKIIVSSRDPAKVIIKESEKTTHEDARFKTFQVEVADNVYPFYGLKIDIIDPETKQHEYISISYNLETEVGLVDASDDPFISFWTAVGVGTLTFALAYIISVVCSKESS